MAADVRTLRHADVLQGAAAAVARARLSPGRPRALHDHDFFELLWVQNGTLRHHRPEGHADHGEGTLLFLRPGDAHALQGRGEEARAVSVSLRAGVVDGLAARHPSLAGHLFWGAAPAVHLRDSRRLADLNAAALRLEAGPRDALAAEAFLLPLCASLIAEAPPPGAPAWLAAACLAAREDRVLREGAAGFVRAAGRAHPHVSREARRFLGRTPTEYVNDRRVERACALLAGTSDTLPEVAEAVGLPNLSHFHRVFRAARGVTPLAFRRLHQRDVLQP